MDSYKYGDHRLDRGRIGNVDHCTRAVPPTAAIAATTACAGSAAMSATVTAAPSDASRSAVARPIPEPPPVTIATLPVNLATRPPARQLLVPEGVSLTSPAALATFRA